MKFRLFFETRHPCFRGSYGFPLFLVWDLSFSSFHHEFPARCLLDNAYIVAKNVLGVLFLQRFRFFAKKLKKLLPKLDSPPKRALHEKFSISLHLFVFQRFTGKKPAKHHGVFSRRYGCDGHLGRVFDGQ